MSTYTTTRKQFDIFVAECKKWVKEFGLNEWEINFLHQDMGDCLAEGSLYENARIITLRFSTKWRYGNKPTIDKIKQTARHEMCHLLIRPLTEKAMDLYTYNFLEKLEHMIIHKIQGIMK